MIGLFYGGKTVMASNPKGTGSDLARGRGARATSGKAAKPAGGAAESAAEAGTSGPKRRAAAKSPAAEGASAAPAKAKTAAKTRSAASAKPKAAAKSAPKVAPKPAAKSATKPRPKPADAPAPAEAAAVRAQAPEAEDQMARAASTRSGPIEGAAAAAPAGAETAVAEESTFERFFAAARVPLPQDLAENIERIEVLSQRLMSALASRPMPNPGVEAPGPGLYVSAANAWMRMLAEHPARIIEQQVNFWGETLKQYAKAGQMLARGRLEAPEDNSPKDRRFSNPLWRTHPYFNYVKRQYQINADAMRAAAADLDMPDQVAKRRIDWLTGQIVDMMAPTNFLATNPDALEKAVETEGESLVKGLENLVRDVEQNGGEFLVSLADRDAFTVGENIGTAPGRVVHRSPLFELIQYAPTTETVHALPVVVFPPWINKFYILDLKPENSLIRWVVGQGHTLFVISWKNPDASYAGIGMSDYVAAYIEAMDKVLELTGQKKLNAVGYCIAGTTLSATLGVLKKRGDERVNSATFFTTLTDFSDLGEFTTFLQDDFLSGIEEEVARKGLFGAALMSRTMSFLRANDLVWQPAIRNYMMGEKPPAFDLLFWNGDSTNLPGQMTLDYLNGLCRENQLAGAGFKVLGESVTLADVTVPVCSIACETDHIAPWKDCWRGLQKMGSRDKRFILSESGHIAGIVNPPSKKKYGHYLGGGFGGTSQDWKDSATYHEGSWWPVWGKWLAESAGPQVPARTPDPDLPPAPGQYVHERALGA